MSQQTQEINTDNIKASVQFLPGCVVHAEINTTPAAAKAAHSKAVRTINKEISIPGFRKGKAPEKLVEQQFGKHITKEWYDLLLNTSFNELVNALRLYPFGSEGKGVKKAEIKSASLENGATILIEYESYPKIPEVDGSAITIHKVPAAEITETDVDHAIHQLQLRFAEWQDVTDRPLKEGDFADLEIVDANDPTNIISDKFRFEVAEGKMGKWMRKLIIGHNPGDVVEGLSEQEENFDADFQPTKCKITIKSIKEAKLPPVDEELVKKVGLQSLEEFRPKVRKSLEIRAENDQKNEVRAQVEEFLINNYLFDIPASLISAERKEHLDRRVQELSKNEVPVEEMVEQVKKIEENIDNELQKSYRLYFLTQHLARKHDIKVADNEIVQEIFGNYEAYSANLNTEKGFESARSKAYVDLLSRKVLDLLASQAIEK